MSAPSPVHNAVATLTIAKQARPYQILLVFSKTEKEQFAKVKKLWNSQRVDGFLLLTVYHKDRSLRFLKKNGANFVALGTPEDNEISWVDNDNFKAK